MKQSPSIPVRPVWFEPFLQQVKKQLGYPIDLSKFAQLLRWANTSQWTVSDHPFDRLYGVCRLLFLQNHEHETRFREIFRDYIISELDYEQIMMPGKNKPASPEVVDPIQTKEPVPGTTGNGAEPTKAEVITEPADTTEVKQVETVKKYLNLNIPVSEEKDVTNRINTTSGSRFLLSDAYLPLTTREMIHGWRQLRKKMIYRDSRRLDVCSTVQHIAREGMLIEPVFEKEQINSEDLLLILADRRGSMVPFHKLTDKLIQTAVQDGGHRNALVYYFYNYPAGYVYKNPTLTEPISLSELYSMIRPDHTNALIISDAGAARGNMNELRAEKTMEFLYGNNHTSKGTTGLHKSAMFVSWLNPMPRHRWKNSTASIIDKTPDTPMYSIIEDGYGNFINIIEKLMGK
jgi:hypothetical protein